MDLLTASVAASCALLIAATATPLAPSGVLTGTMPGTTTWGSILMEPENGSGESGTAALRDTPAGLVVSLHLKNAKGPQPAHIHQGTCAKLNPTPEYPLHNVVNGTSVTTIKGLTIGALRGKHAINVHESLTDLAHYVSCGDIPPSGGK